MATSSAPQNKASTSIRKYIYIVGPHPLPRGTPKPYSTQLEISNPLGNLQPISEPTSTLVLTSPKSTFVDIRITKPFKDDMPELPNNGGPASRVDWAFGGLSYSKVYPAVPDDSGSSAVASKGDENTTKTVGPTRRAYFLHEVSTRHATDAPADAILPDEGDMYPISATQELEVGLMLDAVSKEWVVYEEMWEDLDLVPVEDKHVAIVLRLEAPEHNARGIVVRVDRYCQGIMRVGDQWVVERWEFQAGNAETKDSSGGEKEGKSDKKKATGAGSWKRTVRVGDMFLPCAVTFRPEILLEHGHIVHKEARWTVHELAEWA